MTLRQDRARPRWIVSLVLSVVVAWAAAGCDADGGGRLGDACVDDADCQSGLCFRLLCIDPEGDEDGDGLLNRLEVALGTDPTERDSDADGVDDRAEVGDAGAPADEDGDGTIDALESAGADADQDCRVDQRDAQDAKADDVPELVGDVCPGEGVCAGSAERHVRCPAGAPECVLAAVPGWEADEQTCDGVDNDCDGATDEPAGCEPAPPDPCGPESPFARPCAAAEDCPDGFCVVADPASGARVCALTCLAACPCGWECRLVDLDGLERLSVCLLPPDLCRPCRSDDDCGGYDAIRCVDQGAAGRFCATRCDAGAACPQGYECGEAAAGAETLSVCLPADGACDCAPAFAGAETTCSVENAFGRCEGRRTCTAEGLSGCSAPVPAPDVCDGVDNDCDGETDEPPGCEADPCRRQPCETDADCPDGACIPDAATGEGYCASLCLETCPCGWECRQFPGALPDVVYVCVPPPTVLCRPCLGDEDCGGEGGDPDARCVDHGPEGRFCGTPCGPEAECPGEYECVEAFEALSLCLPAAGTCACAPAFEGAETTCYVENPFGRCEGVRSCTAEGLSPCSAAVPAAEVCDGADNDCDGETDEDCP